MANPPRTRKRVRPFLRAPDGSAFDKCDECGESVAVALVDMHKCRLNNDLKRVKCENSFQCFKEERFQNQPRSAFRFFMESFSEDCESESLINVDRKGFEKWKNMSKEERQVYVLKAEKVNLAYEEALHKEMDNASEENDEADSAMVGKFDQFHEDDGEFEYSDSYESFWSKRYNVWLPPL